MTVFCLLYVASLAVLIRRIIGTAVQIALCEIFEKALGIEKVGIEDNFFELGGSSLTASKVAVIPSMMQV